MQTDYWALTHGKTRFESVWTTHFMAVLTSNEDLFLFTREKIVRYSFKILPNPFLSSQYNLNDSVFYGKLLIVKRLSSEYQISKYEQLLKVIYPVIFF